MIEPKPLILDRFGRVHNYLRISVTEACNLRCVYCLPSKAIARSAVSLMTADEIYGIATVFRDLGVNKIRLTGGEPLIRKDITDIFHKLKNLGTQLAISTNGLILDKHIKDLLSSGFTTVNISLDSIEPETFSRMTGSGKSEKILHNIDMALQAGLNVKINAVLLKGINDHLILDLINLTSKKNLEVRFIEFMPFAGNQWSDQKVMTRKEIIDHLQIKGLEVDKLKDEPSDTAKKYRVKGFSGTFGVITTMSEPFCNSCNRLRLTSDGKLRNCLFATHETDLLTAYRKGEDIKSMILKNAEKKSESTGGLDLTKTAANRSMISIGG